MMSSRSRWSGTSLFSAEGPFLQIPSQLPQNETYPQWANKKNIILSSFFWGYMVFQVVGGEIAKKYGPKLMLGITMLLSSISCVVLPYFGAQFGYIGVIACRVILGLTQGPLQPCSHNVLSNWIPPEERTKLGNFVYSGAPLGVLIALPAAGAISSSSFGWPAAFYLYGGIGIAWSIFWLIFGSDNPAKSRFISEEERRYIQANTTVDKNESSPTPWKAIFTSAPVYAILVCHCGQNWGYWTMITETPSFMEKILDFNLTSSSLLSALPYLVQWIISNLLSPVAERLIVNNILSVESSRKLCNSIGTLLPALSLFALAFVGKSHPAVTLTILVIGVGMNGGTYSGFNINHMDISPTHSGTLIGLGNTVGNIFALVAPLSVDVYSKISGYDETQEQLWDIVFSVAGVVYVITGIVYILLGSGKEQPWNKSEDNKKSDDEIERRP